MPNTSPTNVLALLRAELPSSLRRGEQRLAQRVLEVADQARFEFTPDDRAGNVRAALAVGCRAAIEDQVQRALDREESDLRKHVDELLAGASFTTDAPPDAPLRVVCVADVAESERIGRKWPLFWRAVARGAAGLFLPTMLIGFLLSQMQADGGPGSASHLRMVALLAFLPLLLPWVYLRSERERGEELEAVNAALRAKLQTQLKARLAAIAEQSWSYVDFEYQHWLRVQLDRESVALAERRRGDLNGTASRIPATNGGL